VVKAREGATKEESEDALEDLLAALEGRKPAKKKSKQKAGEKAKMATGGDVDALLASLGFDEYSGGSMDDLLKTIR
jgi:hypothetical protein